MRLTKIWVGLVLSLFLVVPAFAVPIIDLGTGNAGPSGTVIVSGGNVIGTDIFIDSLNVSGAALNNGNYNLTGYGKTTKENDPDETAALLNFDTSTKTFSIVGGVPGLGIPDGTALLTGTITSFSFTQTDFSLMLLGQGSDTKSPLLMAALGETGTSFYFEGFSISANTKGTGSPYVATGSDFQNVAKVPESGILILLGISMASLAGLRRWWRE